MYERRELEAGLVLYVPDLSIADDDWPVQARAYVDGDDVSGSGAGRLRADDLKVLKLLTDSESLCNSGQLKSGVWGAGDHEEKLKGAIFRLRTIGLGKLGDDAKTVIRNVPRKGYIYEGSVQVGKVEELPPKTEAASERDPGDELVRIPAAATESPAKLQVGWMAAGAVVLAAATVGYAAHDWISARLAAEPAWERLEIRSAVDGQQTLWGVGASTSINWTDISWAGHQGWLCGITSAGGPGGEVGEGILLHTADDGQTWSRIDPKIESGAGSFNWGTTEYRWSQVGPLWAMHVYPRVVKADEPRMELWLAATTGIYESPDGGETWRRSTPAPDDTRQQTPYAEFGNLFRVVSSEEVFAVGWQGISHWTGADRSWEVQLRSEAYHINSVVGYPGDSSYRDVWAVGQSGEQDPCRMIYHLAKGNTWEKFAVSGLKCSAKDGLQDLVFTSPDAALAVGHGGAIVKGIRSNSGAWSWHAAVVPGAANTDLESAVYTNRTLLIVGADGTVLTSVDQGNTWKTRHLTGAAGSRPCLHRVRRFANFVWAVGDNAVFRHPI